MIFICYTCTHCLLQGNVSVCHCSCLTRVKFSMPIYGVQKLPIYRVLLNSNPSPEAQMTFAPWSCKLVTMSPLLLISRMIECFGMKISKTLRGVICKRRNIYAWSKLVVCLVSEWQNRTENLQKEGIFKANLSYKPYFTPQV